MTETNKRKNCCKYQLLMGNQLNNKCSSKNKIHKIIHCLIHREVLVSIYPPDCLPNTLESAVKVAKFKKGHCLGCTVF